MPCYPTSGSKAKAQDNFPGWYNGSVGYQELYLYFLKLTFVTGITSAMEKPWRSSTHAKPLGRGPERAGDVSKVSKGFTEKAGLGFNGPVRGQCLYYQVTR